MDGTDAGDRAARLERERTFHDDRFADEHRHAAKYYAVDTGRDRYETLIDEVVPPGRSVLEYGCGTGSKAFELARTGAQVVGTDISGVGVAEATARAGREGVRADFIQMDAEQFGYGPGSFDLVCGSGILHHLDMERSLAEVRRVLKPGGMAVFYEPLGTNPIINLYRRLTPSMRTRTSIPSSRPASSSCGCTSGRSRSATTTSWRSPASSFGASRRSAARWSDCCSGWTTHCSGRSRRRGGWPGWRSCACGLTHRLSQDPFRCCRNLLV